MKNSIIAKLSLLALGSIFLNGCGGGSEVNLEVADEVFDGNSVYFVSGTEENLSAKIAFDGDLQGAACGRVSAESGQYQYKDGIVTLSADFLAKISGTGEKTIVLSTSLGKVVLNALVCTAIISTAAEFQAIGDSSTSLQGTYVLGNDIDLSSIENFEPLGWYVEETDPNNAYFHGILEGNGHTIKNAKVHYADSVVTNYNVYNKTGTYFKHDGHVSGDNIGLFQVIGSSGVVRNCNFSNIDVLGRTIVGALAGNVMGTVYNCYFDGACKVAMGTHFYDDDCNLGGVVGIVSGTGSVYNCISEITDETIGGTAATQITSKVNSDAAGVYVDFDDSYVGTTGNGWDDGGYEGDAASNNYWKYCAVDREDTSGNTVLDSNGAPSNGQYAFVGKCWGSVRDCVAKSFNITPQDGTARAVHFGQTHVGNNKPTSGDSDMGSIENCVLLDETGLKTASNYSSFDSLSWNISDGSVPTLKSVYAFAEIQSGE